MIKEPSQKLDQIAKKIKVCKKCPLWKNSQAVPGEGSPKKKIVLIGEAPGYHESVQGRPFVGAAGRLLDSLLLSVRLKRKEVFITNILKHRPPNNRNPLPEEIEACQFWLDKQIRIIQPRLVITLGRFAMNKFVPDGKISQIHGQARWVNFGNLRFVVLLMYHPAAALRNGEVMKKIKDDFLTLPQILGSLNNQTIPEISPNEKKPEQMPLY
jgi:uracil-DNA glycosylase family 4